MDVVNSLKISPKQIGIATNYIYTQTIHGLLYQFFLDHISAQKYFGYQTLQV